VAPADTVGMEMHSSKSIRRTADDAPMTREDEDRQLLSRLAGGDLEALGTLYDAHGAWVYRLLVRRGLGREAAEDLLQEVFLALLERGRGAARIENLPAYLATIARNLSARNAGREQRRTRLTEALAVEGTQGAPSTGELAARQAVAALPREQAQVVALKLWHELTFAQIGRVLRASPHTAASRYRYALVKLRKVWGGMSDVR
jgi:RNA polymerase sigma-70 factor, ECF subfamily